MATKKKRATPALDPSFYAKKPISAWNRPLQLDAKGLFGALAKGALHSFTGQWTELGGDTVDGLSALGIDSRDAPQLAWLLLRRALTSAMADLIQESLPGVGESKKELEDVARQLDEALENEEVAVDRSLFNRPRDLPLLGVIQKPFAQWLEAYGLTPPEATSVADRLPSYFVLALHTEWRNSPATYDPISKAVDTPFTRAAERERAWAAYAARLERQVDEPMFGESFGLRQVYVPLRAFYLLDSERDRLASARGVPDERAEDERRVAVRLEEEIDSWLASNDRRDSYRVLSGGPGSGKSSFMRMYAARIAREGRIRLLFIPLHQLNISGSLVEAVGGYIRDAGLLPFNPLDPETGEERLLLLLDGLDELSLQGRIGAEAARDFVREVLKSVDIRNHERRRLLVLLTGREPVIQASESEFRERRRVLHALPYFIEKPKREDHTWKEGKKILAEDQRPLWWKAYGKASGRAYAGLPKELKREDLDEITAQPLLNYLVALSYGRGQLSFSQDLNLNDIYRDLLDAVHERAYEQRRTFTPIQGLSLEEFRRILEEVALSAWHGSGRTTSVADIEAHCQAAGVFGLLERFAEGAKAGVTRVLTAFYFRQFGRTPTGDPTFEFTHKSFREYLTALRIVDALGLMEDEMERRRQRPGSGWDEAQALRHWTEICGPSRMDWELWVFVEREIRRRDRETALRWQSMVCHLISVMLRNGMPMELLVPRPAFQEEARQARNAEEALLAVLSACARSTRELSRIEWPQLESDLEGDAAFGAWLKRLQGQRTGANNTLAFFCLSYLDLSGLPLYSADLYAANLEMANLKDAGLFMANLGWANLRWTNLEKADLRQTNLEEVRLEGANLRGAYLEGANLKEANLEGAILSKDQLRGTRGHFHGSPRFLEPKP
jgi:hypothetical protein